MRLEWPGNVYSDEKIASAEVGIHEELLLNAGVGGVLPQAGCNLSAVLDRKQVKVAVALLENEVVCLPYLFSGGMERKPGIRKAMLGEGGVRVVLVAAFHYFCLLDMCGESGAPGRAVGGHDERSFLV